MADSDIFRVTNGEGRTFNVNLIRPGEPDRHGGRGQWQNPTMPIVEFYDAAYEGDSRFGPYGQFTGGRYYVSDFLEHPKGVGLALHGGVPAWRLEAAAIVEVQKWLRATSLETGTGQP